MGIFSSVRGKARAASVESVETASQRPPSPPPSAPRPAPLRGRSLRDELHQLYLQRPLRAEFAQKALEIMAGVGGIKAAALLAHQQRPERMWLQAHVGLDAEAVRVLGSDAKTGGWDIPLRSLRNRRINVIESAQENPFVPPSLAAVNPRRLTIAVLPFFQGQLPVGVAVFFSPTHRGFPDTLLQGLSQALRVCATALTELPADEAEATDSQRGEGDDRPQPNLLRGLNALKAELARLTQALEEAERQRATEATERVSAQSFLQAERQRRASLEQEIEDLRETRGELPALQAEIERLTRALAEASAASEADGLRIREIEAALAERERRVEEAVRELSEVTAAREDLNRQLASTLATIKEREDAAAALERAIAERTAEAERLRADASGARSEAEREVDRALQLASDLEAERDQVKSRLEETRASMEKMAAEREILTTEIAALTARLETLEAERKDAAALEEQLAVLREEFQRTQASLSSETREREEKARQAAQRIKELEDEVDGLERRSRGEIEKLQARIDEGEQGRRRLDDELQRLSAERAELVERIEVARQEQERLVAALAEKDLLLQSAEEGLSRFDSAAEQEENEEEILEIDRSYSGSAPIEEENEEFDEVDGTAETVVTPEVVLLEGEPWAADAARRLNEFGHRALCLSPAGDVATQLEGRVPTCTAINLAAPSAWQALRHMRNGSGVSHSPMLAYALAPDAAKGFWLGPVDFILLPVGEKNLGKLLRGMVPQLRRALAMSNDIDVVSEVRTQLSEMGISTAVVLDGRQALDLVSTVRPEGAVLHLTPSCADIFRTVAGLRSAEASRNIPILFLLDHEAEPREEAFLEAGVRSLLGRGNLPPGELVNSLAAALHSYRPA
jgi:CheY-like chemotaxis protein